MTYNIIIITIITMIVCTKWIIGSIPVQKMINSNMTLKYKRHNASKSKMTGLLYVNIFGLMLMLMLMQSEILEVKL